MHIALADEILKGCRDRADRGVDLAPINAPHGPETYEECIIELGRQRDSARADTLNVLADAIRKFAPDLAEDLRQRWNTASGKDLIDLLNSFNPK